MILKGRARADGQKLAAYLLSPKNEQVQVLDVRGLVEDERSPQGLRAALSDMDALAKMTRARSSLFHLAVNPHDQDRLAPDDWRACIEKVEKSLGLSDHPRVVVSHTYAGKEHCHVVWSRVDVETRTCASLSFSHLKLCRAAREIESELDLQPTPEKQRGPGHVKQRVHEAEHHQAARTAHPKETRNAIISAAWHQATNGYQFKRLIEAAHYGLAVGTRGVIVMDAHNEPHSISRCVKGVRAKEVQDKLADLEGLPLLARRRQKIEHKLAADTATGAEMAPVIQERSDIPSTPTRRQGRNALAEDVQAQLISGNTNTSLWKEAQTWEQYQEHHRERLEEERQRQAEWERPGPTLEP